MCELDVTAIVASIAPRDYSASVAELGNDAGRFFRADDGRVFYYIGE